MTMAHKHTLLKATHTWFLVGQRGLQLPGVGPEMPCKVLASEELNMGPLTILLLQLGLSPGHTLFLSQRVRQPLHRLIPWVQALVCESVCAWVSVTCVHLCWCVRVVCVWCVYVCVCCVKREGGGSGLQGKL